VWRGLGGAYRLPTLSSVGASLAGGPAGGRGKTGKERQSHNLLLLLNVMASSLEVPPCFRFHTPLIEPDVRICRIRLSEKTHAIAVAIACDAVCHFACMPSPIPRQVGWNLFARTIPFASAFPEIGAGRLLR
jgi:hypothetical protein